MILSGTQIVEAAQKPIAMEKKSYIPSSKW